MSEPTNPLRLEGGLHVNPATGRIHGSFKHDPSTLRLSMAAPSLHQIPRGATELQKLVRGWFVAPAGSTFLARDFSGIEAVLVGYFANAPRVIRIFKLDGHSYFTAWAMYELEKGVLTYQDLPQESWSDADLTLCLKGIKKRFGDRRTTNKKITHGRNYRESAMMAQVIMLNDLGVLLPIKDIDKVMRFYDELFPEIPRWHLTLAAEVGGAKPKCPPQRWGYEAHNCYVRQPFGLVHRYYDTIKWDKTPQGWEWSFGEDSKRLIAMLPQSTARFIQTSAAQRVWEQYPEVGRYFRLLIHDEIFLEVPEAEADHCDEILRQEMERPVPELVMPDGSLLSIGSEGKRGQVWSEMS